jgi:hypothetical protein
VDFTAGSAICTNAKPTSVQRASTFEDVSPRELRPVP